jgi:hypothetical protein
MLSVANVQAESPLLHEWNDDVVSDVLFMGIRRVTTDSSELYVRSGDSFSFSSLSLCRDARAAALATRRSFMSIVLAVAVPAVDPGSRTRRLEDEVDPDENGGSSWEDLEGMVGGDGDDSGGGGGGGTHFPGATG